MFGSECLYTIDRVVVMVSLDFIFYHSIKCYGNTIYNIQFTLHSSSMRIKLFKLGSIYFMLSGDCLWRPLLPLMEKGRRPLPCFSHLFNRCAVRSQNTTKLLSQLFWGWKHSCSLPDDAVIPLTSLIHFLTSF